jgi:futalosine hydrolase
MSFKILYVTATASESEALKKVGNLLPVAGGYHSGSVEISVLATGVGSISTAWSLHKWISANARPDLAINTGIAGSFKDELPVGEVVMPVSECFADAGIEEDNKFLTLSEAGLTSANEFPFREGLIHADPRYSAMMSNFLKPVSAITVNTVTGSEATRNKLIEKFNPDIESMEGATFFYICTRGKIPFLAIRAISNRVGIRDKNSWNIALALENLTEKLNEVLITLK